MDTSSDPFTTLLLTYGDIQTSPQHAITLNQAPMLAWGGKGAALAGYQVILTGYVQFVMAREEATDTALYLEDLLKSLRSFPRPPSARILKNSVATYSYETGFYRADYRIANGQVIVYNIQPVDRIQKQRNRMERVALYKVKRNSQGVWEVGSKIEKIDTPHAAVNGQLNNLAKATWLMGAHLDHAFGHLNEYTLFHNPSEGFADDTWESFRDKIGITTPTTREFAKVLLDTQHSGQAVKWVAHSQGSIIFAEGVRYVLNGSSSWALNRLSLNGSRHPEKGAVLDVHSVVFHGNANNNLRSRPLFKRAGVKIIAVRNNDYDFVHNILGANTLNLRKLLGSAVHVNHVLSGSVLQSPHTLPHSQKTWRSYMDKGPGKGRNALQRAFHKVDRKLAEVRAKPNYLP